MAAATSARSAALTALRAVRRGQLADVALDRAVRELEPRDRAWTHELVYGTLRLRGRIDHRLAGVSRRPLTTLDPDVLDCLRLGTYQLLHMGGVPEYAAVSESVELARAASGQGAAGFVNGVLRTLRRTAATMTFPDFTVDPVAHLTTWGSHPLWLVQRWLERFGADGAARLVSLDNTQPELYLRVLGDVAGASARLEAAGIVTESVPAVPRALRVLTGSARAALAAAPVIVQDPAAGLVVDGIGEWHGVAIDMAAAPGGKALALADTGRGFIAAADPSLPRLRRLTENVARTGAGALGLAPVVADGRAPPFRHAALVLLDAPCTGTGTLRRHPDGKWRIGPEDLRALVRRQHELLESAAALVQPDGLLVYATCSLEPEENEVQVTSFLERHAEFVLEPGPRAAADGMLHVLPQEHGFDGAFAARLRRRGAR